MMLLMIVSALEMSSWGFSDVFSNTDLPSYTSSELSTYSTNELYSIMQRLNIF